MRVLRFDDDPTFEDLLARVKRMTLDAFEHQRDFPFEKVGSKHSTRFPR